MSLTTLVIERTWKKKDNPAINSGYAVKMPNGVSTNVYFGGKYSGGRPTLTAGDTVNAELGDNKWIGKLEVLTAAQAPAPVAQPRTNTVSEVPVNVASIEEAVALAAKPDPRPSDSADNFALCVALATVAAQNPAASDSDIKAALVSAKKALALIRAS